jgi:hypothetical protein
VTILTLLLTVYLEDLQKAAHEERINGRKLVGFLERLLVLVTSKNA